MLYESAAPLSLASYTYNGADRLYESHLLCTRSRLGGLYLGLADYLPRRLV